MEGDGGDGEGEREREKGEGRKKCIAEGSMKGVSRDIE